MPARFAFLALALTLPAATPAQDGRRGYTPADLEKAIRTELKLQFAVDNTPVGKRFDLLDTPDFVTFDEKEKRLLFHATFPKGWFKDPLTPERVREWNRRSETTRAALAPDGSNVKFESPLGVAGGLEPGQVKAFYARFERDRADFLQHLNVKPQPPVTTGPPEVLRQGFPVSKSDPDDLAASDTGWEIAWDIPNLTRRRSGGDSRVLRVVSARFFWKDEKRQPRSVVVVRNLLLMEAFSQYDNKETCFLDVAKVGTPMLKADREFLGPGCVGPGRVLASKNADHDGKVYQELHYDGLRWVSLYGGTNARRGEKLVLWAAMRSGNYAFLTEYNFTDDGRIVARLGFTAHNFFDRAKLPPQKGIPRNLPRMRGGDVHAHFGCWRFDFDLGDPEQQVGGPTQNAIQLVRRTVTDGKFGQRVTPFPGPTAEDGAPDEPREGKAKWVASEFTTLRAESQAVKNSRGHPLAYDLMTSRTGSAADLLAIGNTRGLNMDFINYDYWVTRTPETLRPYHQVTQAAAEGRSLRGEPTTVWHSVGSLHTPRDEDFGPDALDASRGAALTEWVGFTLRPRNLFDGTPAFGNK